MGGGVSVTAENTRTIGKKKFVTLFFNFLISTQNYIFSTFWFLGRSSKVLNLNLLWTSGMSKEGNIFLAV